MPTTYAHDLFGKLVYKSIPKEMQKVIRKHGDLYRIGLHGPDILFYHLFDGKVNQLGVEMHKKRAKSFFEKGMERVRRTGDEALCAYLLGFGCHYLLDTSCHPYINSLDKKGVITHTLLEKEFDRMLMIQTRKNPYFYYPSDCIVPKPEYARVIHRAIPAISAGKIFFSLRMMKFATNAMVYDDGGKKRMLIGLLAHLAGKKRRLEVMDHFMRKEPPADISSILEEVKRKFQEGLGDASVYLKELYLLSKENKPLSFRWNLTYNGTKA